jgi:hypothetical protein
MVMILAVQPCLQLLYEVTFVAVYRNITKTSSDKAHRFLLKGIKSGGKENACICYLSHDCTCW